MSYEQSSAWTPEKASSFRAAFEEFLYYVEIDSKEEGPIALGGKLYDAQIRFLDTVFDALAEDIRAIYVLKSRQLGLSTASRALTVFWLGMHDGLNGAIILDTNPHKEDARREIEAIVKKLPAKLKFPTIESANRDSLRLSNGSRINFMSAGTKKTAGGGSLGRGVGTNFAHLSELCTYNNDEGISSFQKSLAKDFPNRLYIYESTGRGYDQWYSMWQDARADDLSKRCVFLGWWSKPNQRLKRGTALFERYGREQPTEVEQAKIDEVLARYGAVVDQEMLAWYRKESNPRGFKEGAEDADEDGLPDDEFFGREQPWTEDEAFSQSGSTFFPADRLTKMSNEQATDEYQAWKYYAGLDFLDMKIERARTRRETQLKVWEDPKPDGVYVVAADPAYGANEANDRSAIQVMRCYADKIEQVAEFCSTMVQPFQFAWIIASLLGHYGCTRLILEINGPGTAVWQEIASLKRILTQGYLKKESEERGLKDYFSNCKNYLYARPDALIPGQGSVHWKTQGPNKVAFMERLRDFTTNGTLILRSRDVISEMRTVTRDGDTIKSEGSDHDDRVLAVALGVLCWEQHERKQLIAQGRTREFEIAKGRLSIQDQFSLLSKYQLNRYFNSKESARRKAIAEARRNQWRGK